MIMEIKRIAVIVLDGVGAGELPDADQYGDVGSNSLANTARVMGGLNLPNMGEMGIGISPSLKVFRHARKPAVPMVSATRFPKERIL
jgi:phosphopentomutase